MAWTAIQTTCLTVEILQAVDAVNADMDRIAAFLIGQEDHGLTYDQVQVLENADVDITHLRDIRHLLYMGYMLPELLAVAEASDRHSETIAADAIDLLFDSVTTNNVRLFDRIVRSDAAKDTIAQCLYETAIFHHLFIHGRYAMLSRLVLDLDVQLLPEAEVALVTSIRTEDEEDIVEDLLRSRRNGYAYAGAAASAFDST
jgi:hypothetical protein